MGKIKLQKIVRNLIDKLRKLYMNGHLERFSLPQAIENSRQLLLLRTDISQKTVTGCPWLKVASGMFWFSKERYVSRRLTSIFSIVILEEFLCSKFENIIELSLRHDSSFAGSQAGSNHKMSQHHLLLGNLSSKDQNHQSLRGYIIPSTTKKALLKKLFVSHW